jgi:2-polyprenyl-3-methyl-5-hydroxy-6-metoxy-1,4-benzoquinol methylase
VRCKLCGAGPLRVAGHVARCTACGALMYYPYPTTADVVESGFYTAAPDGAEGYFREWYTEATPRNHLKLTHILQFAVDGPTAGEPLDFLDYGGGGGQFGAVAASLCPRARTWITDLYDDGLLPAWAGFSTQIPFAEFAADARRFDYVFLNDVCEHVSDPVALLRDLAGRLKPGGRILVNTPKTVWIFAVLRVLAPALHARMLRGMLTMGHLQLWSRKALERAAARAGLRVVRWKDHSEFTMGPAWYADGLGLRNPLLRGAAHAYYALSPWIGRNKIIALLEPDPSS